MAACVISLLNFTVNAFAAGMFLRIVDKVPLLSYWQTLRPMIPGYFAVVPVAYLLLVVQKIVGILGTVLFLLPIISARYALQRSLEIRNQLIATVKSLTTALEARDENTFGHSGRVAKLAYEVARELGVKQPDLEWVQMAALLHDIGKIGVSDEILKKKGSFSEEEFIEMAKHTVVGERIVAQSLMVRDVARLVRCHHERFDGRGYPDRLAGEQIPLGARIISVCDAFDAMTSTRPYRERLSVEYALAELRRKAGTQFDPRVVAALCKVVQDPRRLAEIYQVKYDVEVFLAPLSQRERQAAAEAFRLLCRERQAAARRDACEVAAAGDGSGAVNTGTG